MVRRIGRLRLAIWTGCHLGCAASSFSASAAGSGYETQNLGLDSSWEAPNVTAPKPISNNKRPQHHDLKLNHAQFFGEGFFLPQPPLLIKFLINFVGEMSLIGSYSAFLLYLAMLTAWCPNFSWRQWPLRSDLAAFGRWSMHPGQKIRPQIIVNSLWTAITVIVISLSITWSPISHKTQEFFLGTYVTGTSWCVWQLKQLILSFHTVSLLLEHVENMVTWCHMGPVVMVTEAWCLAHRAHI